MKKIIIAICGPSASGKDYLAKVLIDNDVFPGANKIVRDTTRPKRDGEVDGVDYNFIDSNLEFLRNACDNAYFEYSKYRGWYYGAKKVDIKDGINIGVFDYKSLEKLANIREYTIVPIYCKCGLKLRLRRSVKRENKFKFEYIRRAVSDFRDYLKFKRLLPRFVNYKVLDTEHLMMKECQEVVKIFMDYMVISNEDGYNGS